MWADCEEYMQDWAAEDLRMLGSAVPCLAAFHGEDLLLVAWLRDLPARDHHQQITELLAVTVPLGADRIAMAMTGRAWSLDDPVAPVTEDADLRQRVLIVELADGTGRGPRQTTVVVPFELREPDGDVAWGRRQVLHDGVGWIPEALQAAVASAGGSDAVVPDHVIASRVRWLSLLGHDVFLAQDLERRLASTLRPGSGAPRG